MPRSFSGPQDTQAFQTPPPAVHEVLPDHQEARNRFLYLRVLSGDAAAGVTLDLDAERNRFWQSVQANIREDDARRLNPRPRFTRRTAHESAVWTGFWGFASRTARQDAARHPAAPLPAATPRRLRTRP